MQHAAGTGDPPPRAGAGRRCQRRSSRGALALLLLGGALALGCAEEPAPEPEVVQPVKAVVFGQEGRARTFSYPGRVYPNTSIEVSFEVPGQIVELPVAKGQMVEVGELIARLDQRDFENDLAAAEAIAQEAAATRSRYELAAKSGAVSRQEVDEAVSRARATAADVRIKRKALEDSEIRAKISGIVADRYVEAFQRVKAKEPILSLQDISTLEVRINAPERDMGGDVLEDPEDIGRLSARFATVPGRVFELELKELVTDADPVTQTFPVTLEMENPADTEILPGMTATVVWEPPAALQAGSNSVPTAAVLAVPPAQTFVWVIDPESMRVSKREVSLGELMKGDRVEVLSGLEPGETVAAAGAYHLDEGVKVRFFDPKRFGRSQ